MLKNIHTIFLVLTCVFIFKLRLGTCVGQMDNKDKQIHGKTHNSAYIITIDRTIVFYLIQTKLHKPQISAHKMFKVS